MHFLSPGVQLQPIQNVEAIQQCVEKVASYYGLVLGRIPRVEDIEHEGAFD